MSYDVQLKIWFAFLLAVPVATLLYSWLEDKRRHRKGGGPLH